MKAQASARKSLGEYKPLIKFVDCGRVGRVKTEVVEKSEERAATYTKYGYVGGNRYARGNTYATRDEAIAAAQAEIDRRREWYINHAEKNEELRGHVDTYSRQQAEIYS